MILAEKLQFSTNFSKKSVKHSSTIVLPWKQWVSHETHMCLKRKVISLYEKSESFGFLPFTVLAQQREKHGCGWIPPPPPPCLIGLTLFTEICLSLCSIFECLSIQFL